MKEYLSLVQDILNNGDLVSKDQDRTGTGYLSIFGSQTKYDLRKSFPLITTKDMSGIRWRGIVKELLWFLSGSTNVNSLKSDGINIWNAWADTNGDLGPVYGHQWRKWQTIKTSVINYDGFTSVQQTVNKIDQISKLIKDIKENPHSRRLIVSAWNVGDLDKMALPPCHTMWQINVVNNHMDLQLYCRSQDVGLGTPYNIASYSLLLHMIAHVTGYSPRYFIHTIGNAHIYLNHVDKLKEQITRTPFEAPTLKLNPLITNIDDFKFDDFELINYKHHPSIKLEIAV